MNQELEGLAEPDVLAPALRDAIEREIVPGYLAQQRQQRTIALLVFIVFIVSLFPFVIESLVLVLEEPIAALGLPITPRDGVADLGGLIGFVGLAFSARATRLKSFVTRHRAMAVLSGALLVAMWLAMVSLVIYKPIGLSEGLYVVAAILSFVPFVLGLRVFHALLTVGLAAGRGQGSRPLP